ncbi:transposase [Prevotella sp. HUN102]|uniref:transposase n=1 Tax=Prevotella sp. HUN102 TaxID=1392486 RepID=UPI0021011C70|nr:transposase [Prevotella sp. HUN102]
MLKYKELQTKIAMFTEDKVTEIFCISDKLLLRKRAIIETVNDELKNIAQVEHSRHRSFDNFIVNLLGAIAAYCLFPKKPCINVQRTLDTQLALF